jgi:hypothetical protein
MKRNAYILYAAEDDRHYEKIDISKKNGEFDHDGITYKIRESATFLARRGKMITKFKLLPWLIKIYEHRLYYQAGHPEPIGWTRPQPKEIDGKKIAFWAEDLYNAAMEKTSWRNLFRIGGGSGNYLGWLLIIGIVIAGIIGIVVFLPYITGVNIA